MAPPNVDRKLLIDELHSTCRVYTLKPTDGFVGKILQIYEMMVVRHGFMVVGEVRLYNEVHMHIM